MIFFKYIWPNISPNIYESAYHLISKEKIEKPDVSPIEQAESVSFKNWSNIFYLYWSSERR